MIVTEKWPISTVTSWLANPDNTHHADRRIVQDVCENGLVSGEYYSLPREYKRAKNSVSHRLFSMGSMQTCSAGTEAAILPDAQDIDCVNCGPTILNQILKDADLRCWELDEYVKHRDQFLSDMDMPRGAAKKLITAILYGAGVRHVQNAKLINLKDGIRYKVKDLSRRHESTWNKCGRNLGRFITALISAQEAKIVATWFHGLDVICNKLDGCLINDFLTDDEIEERNIHTRRVTGMPVTFIAKEHAAPAEFDIDWEGRLLITPFELYGTFVQNELPDSGIGVAYYTMELQRRH